VVTLRVVDVLKRKLANVVKLMGTLFDVWLLGNIELGEEPKEDAIILIISSIKTMALVALSCAKDGVIRLGLFTLIWGLVLME
jgi:hypothetical protein